MPKKIIRKQVVEQRNACDIDLVEEEIEMVKGPAKRIQTYRVLTTKKAASHCPRPNWQSFPGSKDR